MKMNKFLYKVDKAKYLVTSAAAAVALGTTPLTAFAGQTGAAQGTQDAGSMVKNILNAIVGFMPIAALIFMFMGGFKLIQAIRNDNNPEGISSAIKDFIVAGLFLGFSTIVWDNIQNAF